MKFPKKELIGHNLKRKKYIRTSKMYLFLVNTYFVETSDSQSYHKHLSKKEIDQICNFIVEKNGIMGIERITGHHRDTIGSFSVMLMKEISKNRC